MLSKKFITGVGDTVKWTVPVAYEGSGINTNVKMTFAIPTQFEVIGSNPTRGAYDAVKKEWIVGDMSPDETQTIELTLSMVESDSHKSHAFVATASGDLFDSDNTNNTLIDTLSVQSVCAKATANPDKFGIINFDLSANDIGCTEGVTKWDIDTGSLSNIEVLEYDDSTGVGIARLTNPLAGGSLSYKIFCDVGQGFLETAGPATVEYYALFDDAWIPAGGGGGGEGSVGTLTVSAGVATFNSGATGAQDVTFNVGWTTLTRIGDSTIRVTYPSGGIFTFNDGGGTGGHTSSYTDNGNGTYTLNNGNGSEVVVNTVSTIVDNGSTFTFTNSNGQQVSISKVTAANISSDAGNDIVLGSDSGAYFSEALTSIAYDGTTGNLIYTNEAGQAQIVNLEKENFLSAASYNSSTEELVLTMKNGATVSVPLSALVDDDTLTSISQGNGQIAYVDENGDTTSIQIGGVIALGDGLFTYTGGAGATPVVVPTGNVSVDANNDLTQGADGWPYFSESLTTLVKNGDGSLTYTDENGGTTQIILGPNTAGDPVTGVAFTPGTRNLVVTLQSGTNFTANIPTAPTETITDNGDGTFTFVSSDTTSTTVDFLADIVDNGDKTYTYTNAIGGTQTIDTNVQLSAVAGNKITIETDGGIYHNDVLTTLSYSAGTLTYTNEAAQITNISLPTENFLNNVTYNSTTKVLTFSFEDTPNVDVSLADLVDNETLTGITRSGGTLTYTDENAGTFNFTEGGVSTDANNSVTAGADGKPFFTETVTSVSNELNVITYIDENGLDTPLTLPVASIATDGEGEYTFADGIGGTTVFNTAVQRTDELFTDLASGNSVTISAGLAATQTYDVYKNGVLQTLTLDYTLSASESLSTAQIVFIENFDGTKNGGNGDRVLVRIFS